MSLQTYTKKMSNQYNIDIGTKKKPMSKMYSKHFDKLNNIALLFENETCAIFEECLSDKVFSKIIIDNKSEDTKNIVKKLCDYANNYLI